MICTRCNKDHPDKDFLLKKTICYHCVYEIKSKDKKSQTITRNHCRNCGEEIFFDPTAKKRQRSVFCSKECAFEGHKEMSNNHWTRKLRSRVPLYL